MSHPFILFCAAVAVCGCNASVKIGEPLPAWEEGCLDIHAINTGRGECTFFVLPDGTTMMVDAGDMFKYKTVKYACVPQKPSEDVRPCDVFSEYARHFLPEESRDSLDYFILTHFHGDHMGLKAGYGVMGVYSELPFRMLSDRAYPDYDSCRVSDSSKNLDNYIPFVEGAVAGGMKAEKFEVGSSSQFVLRHAPEKYDFRIVNYSANGVAWNGSELVDSGADRENSLSCAFKMSYGAFDYWTSGDNNSITQIKAMAPSVGQVEAMKCMHHMSNPEAIFPEQEMLAPQVVVTQSFYVREIQPHQDVIRELSSSRDMFFTNVADSLDRAQPELYSCCKSKSGHIVIRVSPGGSEYNVYILKDTDFSYEVLAKFGPYKCN